MEDLVQFDTEIYGTGGGPREYGEAEGRFNMGGWLDGPMAFSDFDGKGIWAQPPARDGENGGGTLSPHMGAVGRDEIYSMIRGVAGSPEADGGWY